MTVLTLCWLVLGSYFFGFKFMVGVLLLMGCAYMMGYCAGEEEARLLRLRSETKPENYSYENDDA